MSPKRKNEDNIPSTSASKKGKSIEKISNPFGSDFENFRNCFMEVGNNIFNNKQGLEELYILFEKLADSDVNADRWRKWPEDEHSITLFPERLYDYRTILEQLNTFMATNMSHIIKLKNLFQTLESNGKSVRISKQPQPSGKATKVTTNLIRKFLRLQKSRQIQDIGLLQQTLQMERKSDSVQKCQVLIQVPPEIFREKKKFTIQYDNGKC